MGEVWSSEDKKHHHQHSKPLCCHSTQQRQCAACYENTTSGVGLTCSHFYCYSCLRLQYQNALKDRALLPLRCCGIQMDFSVPEQVLSSSDLAKLRRLEYEEQESFSMVCPNVECAAQLNLQVVFGAKLQKGFSCPACGTNICGVCRQRWHSRALKCHQPLSLEMQYPNDPQMQSLVRRRGWRQCPSCYHMIEKADGCNHMQCRCDAQFCYLCGEEWLVEGVRGCACPQYGERRAPPRLDLPPSAEVDPRLRNPVHQRPHRSAFMAAAAERRVVASTTPAAPVPAPNFGHSGTGSHTAKTCLRCGVMGRENFSGNQWRKELYESRRCRSCIRNAGYRKW